MTPPSTPVEGVPRSVPLNAISVAGFGESAVALARRLLRLEDEHLSRLEGLASDEPKIILVVGKTADLVWVDGVTYLGSEKEAPGLLLPTHTRSTIPSQLLQSALRRRFPDEPGKLAVFFTPKTVLPTGAARPLARDKLESWLEAHG